jgi:tetratricopeptide (TPR) repeat protein
MDPPRMLKAITVSPAVAQAPNGQTQVQFVATGTFRDRPSADSLVAIPLFIAARLKDPYLEPEGTKQAQAQSQTGNFAASLPFFHRAIEIDPNFAMAYWALGDAYSTLGETDSSAEYMRKAFRLRARVSEREKSAVEGDYYFYATGDLMNARRSFGVYAKIYPDSGYAHNMLTGCSMMLGQYGAALNEAREALHLAPFNTFLYRLVALNYLLSELVEDAVATATEAHAKGLDSDLGAVLRKWCGRAQVQ